VLRARQPFAAVRGYRVSALGAVALWWIATGCGFQNPQGPFNGAVGLVNGGGGLEDLDATPLAGPADAETGDGSGGRDGNPGEGGEDAAGGSEGQDATVADAGGGDSAQPFISDAAEAPDGGDGAAGQEDGGEAGAATEAGSNADAAGASDALTGVDGQAEADGGSGALVLNLSGAHLTSLDWAINGPNTYTGAVTIGDAQSIEWIIGGIVAGDGYTITVTATDTSGDPCTNLAAL